MILDTSAIVAVLKAEPHAGWVVARLPGHVLRMSWVNVAELALVASNDLAISPEEVFLQIAPFGIEFLQPDEGIVALVARARERFPLNFGDCFAYAHAKLRNEALLTLDDDFLKTDLAQVLHPDRD